MRALAIALALTNGVYYTNTTIRTMHRAWGIYIYIYIYIAFPVYRACMDASPRYFVCTPGATMCFDCTEGTRDRKQNKRRNIYFCHGEDQGPKGDGCRVLVPCARASLIPNCNPWVHEHS